MRLHEARKTAMGVFSRFRVWGLGFLGFQNLGLGFRVWGLGLLGFQDLGKCFVDSRFRDGIRALWAYKSMLHRLHRLSEAFKLSALLTCSSCSGHERPVRANGCFGG